MIHQYKSISETRYFIIRQFQIAVDAFDLPLNIYFNQVYILDKLIMIKFDITKDPILIYLSIFRIVTRSASLKLDMDILYIIAAKMAYITEARYKKMINTEINIINALDSDWLIPNSEIIIDNYLKELDLPQIKLEWPSEEQFKNISFLLLIVFTEYNLIYSNLSDIIKNSSDIALALHTGDYFLDSFRIYDTLSNSNFERDLYDPNRLHFRFNKYFDALDIITKN